MRSPKRPPGADRKHLDDVRRFYDRESRRYATQRYGRDEPAIARPYLERHELVLELLAGVSGRALDLGCGPGILLPPLLERCEEVVAFDLSREMILRARESLVDHPQRQRVFFAVGSADALPFRDSAFDVVTCIGVVSYWPGLERGLREIARVLKPRGIVVLQASNALAPWEIENRLLRGPIQRALTRLAGRDFRDSSFRLKAYAPRRLDRGLERVGLVPTARRFYDFRPPLLRFVSRSLAERFARYMLRFTGSSILGPMGAGYLVRARREG